MRCTLLNENALCKDIGTGELRSVDSCIRLSQWYLPSQPAASTRDNDKHQPGLFSVSHSDLQRFPESWEGFPSTASHEELRKSLHTIDGTQGKDLPGPVVDGKGAGRRGTRSFP